MDAARVAPVGWFGGKQCPVLSKWPHPVGTGRGT
jgi:hypothetical protein